VREERGEGKRKSREKREERLERGKRSEKERETWRGQGSKG